MIRGKGLLVHRHCQLMVLLVLLVLVLLLLLQAPGMSQQLGIGRTCTAGAIMPDDQSLQHHWRSIPPELDPQAAQPSLVDKLSRPHPPRSCDCRQPCTRCQRMWRRIPEHGSAPSNFPASCRITMLKSRAARLETLQQSPAAGRTWVGQGGGQAGHHSPGADRGQGPVQPVADEPRQVPWAARDREVEVGVQLAGSQGAVLQVVGGAQVCKGHDRLCRGGGAMHLAGPAGLPWVVRGPWHAKAQVSSRVGRLLQRCGKM